MNTTYTVVIVTYNRKELLEECVSKVNSQSLPASHVVIVNNASTDGTDAFLDRLAKKNEKYFIVQCPKNIGGAGGFAKGMEYALGLNDEYVLIIDDDAMLETDYMEKILKAKSINPRYEAFAGSVLTDNKIDVFHRKMLSKAGFLMKNCPERLYAQDTFECDIASFCGMVVSAQVIRQIGLPHEEYFIYHDDTEYSLRVREISRFLVVPGAKLNHKTKQTAAAYPRRYGWKDYYDIRNRLLFVKEHGSVLDKAVNYVHLFANIVFRNWLFGIIKRNHYDWKYERDITKRAIADAHGGKVN
ncbi:MAG: glycosyltransferase [Lachnospiraceae bacterium]|nr:glycosyltransferase [Lachnospiraceae bacterium]